MNSTPQVREREQGCTPVLADAGRFGQLESWFQESGDLGEDLRRKFVDGREGVPDVLCPYPDFKDPWNRVIDLWSTRVKELELIFLVLCANLVERSSVRLAGE